MACGPTDKPSTVAVGIVVGGVVGRDNGAILTTKTTSTCSWKTHSVPLTFTCWQNIKSWTFEVFEIPLPVAGQSGQRPNYPIANLPQLRMIAYYLYGQLAQGATTLKSTHPICIFWRLTHPFLMVNLTQHELAPSSDQLVPKPCPTLTTHSTGTKSSLQGQVR